MYCCIFGSTATDSLFDEEQRLYEKPDPSTGDLDLRIGTFLVCETGVTADLKEPLAMMSRHIPWPQVAPSIGGLLLLALGEGDFAHTMFSMMTEKQHDILESELEGSVAWGDRNVANSPARFERHSPFTASVGELLDWAPKIAAKCPYQSAAYDLQNLWRRDTKQLDSYVKKSFLS